MAYYLGFLHADAYLKTYGTKHRFSVHLSSVDLDWLKLFCSKIQSSYKLQEYTSNWNKPVCRVEITNQTFIQPLIDIKLKDEDILSRIPDEYKKDFIRGLFDGDGCIIVRDRFYKEYNTTCKVIEWEICSPLPNLLKSITEYLEKELQIKQRKIAVNGSIWDFRISSLKDVQKIYKWLYYKDCLFLARKKEKFERGV